MDILGQESIEVLRVDHSEQGLQIATNGRLLDYELPTVDLNAPTIVDRVLNQVEGRVFELRTSDFPDISIPPLLAAWSSCIEPCTNERNLFLELPRPF